MSNIIMNLYDIKPKDDKQSTDIYIVQQPSDKPTVK